MESVLVCTPNIAASGITRRRRVGIAFAVVSVALAVALVWLDASWYLRALLFVPVAISAASLLQATRKTCVAHARKGTIELMDYTARRAPEDVATASRRVASTIVRDASVVAALVAALAAASTWVG